MKYAFEINETLEIAKSNLEQHEEMMKEYHDVVDTGTYVNWVFARHHWKNTIMQLELDLKDAEFNLFREFLKTS